MKSEETHYLDQYSDIKPHRLSNVVHSPRTVIPA